MPRGTAARGAGATWRGCRRRRKRRTCSRSPRTGCGLPWRTRPERAATTRTTGDRTPTAGPSRPPRRSDTMVELDALPFV